MLDSFNKNQKINLEIHLVSQNKMFRSGTLLSYLKKSAFELMLLEIVASFSVQECYEHVKKMFENLAEFQKINCDILLLTKRPTQGKFRIRFLYY